MDKLDTAIQRMQMASELSLAHYKKPILLTYSGGKDSDVCIEIAKSAHIPFEVVNSHTTADAPETVWHIRKKFRELELQGVTCTIEYPYYKGKRTSMWDLIVQKGFPPIRMKRYCCQLLKETAGRGRAIVTGVRWAESLRRKITRGTMEVFGNIKNRIIINDNDDDRRFIEQCQLRAFTIFNPIVDWTDEEVWDYLSAQKVELNPLYSCGFSRVGCIGCPLASSSRRYHEFALYPAYKKMYIHAFDRMLKARAAAGKPKLQWHTGYEVYRWWMEDNPDQLQFDWYEEMVNPEDD